MNNAYRRAQCKYIKDLDTYLKSKVNSGKHGPYWFDRLIPPLIDALKARFPGAYATCHGPVGLCNRVYIRLERDGCTLFSIFLQPRDLEKAEIVYETGRRQETPYPPGSIGALNAMDMICAPLPASAQALIDTVKVQQETK